MNVQNWKNWSINFIGTLMVVFLLPACGFSQTEEKKAANSKELAEIKTEGDYNQLTKHEANIIIQKGTEYPNTGVFNKHYEEGIYVCRQCNFPLFESSSKFNSRSGWPSFDAYINDHVKKETDTDGHRSEILCNHCNGHLGHVFYNEGFTSKNTRHCVNSASLDFIPIQTWKQIKE